MVLRGWKLFRLPCICPQTNILHVCSIWLWSARQLSPSVHSPYITVKYWYSPLSGWLAKVPSLPISEELYEQASLKHPFIFKFSVFITISISKLKTSRHHTVTSQQQPAGSTLMGQYSHNRYCDHSALALPGYLLQCTMLFYFLLTSWVVNTGHVRGIVEISIYEIWWKGGLRDLK